MFLKGCSEKVGQGIAVLVCPPTFNRHASSDGRLLGTISGQRRFWTTPRWRRNLQGWRLQRSLGSDGLAVGRLSEGL